MWYAIYIVMAMSNMAKYGNEENMNMHKTKKVKR